MWTESRSSFSVTNNKSSSTNGMSIEWLSLMSIKWPIQAKWQHNIVRLKIVTIVVVVVIAVVVTVVVLVVMVMEVLVVKEVLVAVWNSINIQDLFIWFWTSLQGRTSPRCCALVYLLELDVSALGLPSPLLWWALCTPLPWWRPSRPSPGAQQQLLGQALKEQGLDNSLQFGILNNLGVKRGVIKRNKRVLPGSFRVQRSLGLGQFLGKILMRDGCVSSRRLKHLFECGSRLQPSTFLMIQARSLKFEVLTVLPFGFNCLYNLKIPVS